MLSAFCHCIPLAFWSAHVSLCQNKCIFEPSNQPPEPEPRDEQQDLYQRRWAVAGDTRSQTVSRSLPSSQRDIDSTETNIWACWAPKRWQFRHHSMGCCSSMHLPLYVATVGQLAVTLQWQICQGSFNISYYLTSSYKKKALKQVFKSKKSQCLTINIPKVVFKSKTPKACVIDLVSCVS